MRVVPKFSESYWWDLKATINRIIGFLERSRAGVPVPDDLKEMVNSFDNEITGTVLVNDPIPIERLLETPAMIANLIWDTGRVDDDARRYLKIFFYI